MAKTWTPLDTGEYPPLYKDVLVTVVGSYRPVIGRWWGNLWTCDTPVNPLHDENILAWMDLPDPYPSPFDTRWLLKEELEERGIIGDDIGDSPTAVDGRV